MCSCIVSDLTDTQSLPDHLFVDHYQSTDWVTSLLKAFTRKFNRLLSK